MATPTTPSGAQNKNIMTWPSPSSRGERTLPPTSGSPHKAGETAGRCLGFSIGQLPVVWDEKGPELLPGPIFASFDLHVRLNPLGHVFAALGHDLRARPVGPEHVVADLLGHDRLDLVGQLRDRLGPRHGGVVVLDRELLRDSAGADRAVRQTPALRFPRVWIRPGNRLELRDEEVVGALEFPVLAFQPGVQLLLSPLVIAEIACHGPIKGPQDAETLVDPGVQLVGWSTRGRLGLVVEELVDFDGEPRFVVQHGLVHVESLIILTLVRSNSSSGSPHSQRKTVLSLGGHSPARVGRPSWRWICSSIRWPTRSPIGRITSRSSCRDSSVGSTFGCVSSASSSAAVSR